jgi:hypothetical protein
MKTIEQFLEEYCWEIPINMNDTFGYALAATSYVSLQDLPKLLEVEEKFGADGVNAFASCVEGMEVIKPHKTEQFLKAKEYLKGYLFWSRTHCDGTNHSIICKCNQD